MNKRVVIILVAILVVLLAAIAVIEIVKPDNNGPEADDLIVNSNGETGVVVDLETGSVIDGSSEGDQTTASKDKILGNEVVGEQNMSTESDNASSNTSSDSSSSTSSDSSTSTNSNQQTMDGFSPWK